MLRLFTLNSCPEFTLLQTSFMQVTKVTISCKHITKCPKVSFKYILNKLVDKYKVLKFEYEIPTLQA